MPEKQTATRMNSDLIETPFCRTTPRSAWRLITGKYPQNIRALRTAPGSLELITYRMTQPQFFQTCTERAGSASPKLRHSNGTKAMLHREHSAMFALSADGMRRGVSAGRPRHSRNHAMIHRPLCMSNFTKPSSRIFNRRDWQASSLTTLARFMTNFLGRSGPRRVMR